MSTDPKAPKPMPSADEINAYLELSAARTKLRLPLAKGAALLSSTPAADEPSLEKNEKRALPLSAQKKLPARPEVEGADAGRPRQSPASSEVWRPFPNDDES